MIEKTKQHTLNMATMRQSSFKPALLALAITQTLLLAAPADALAADNANSEIEVTGRSTAGAATSYTANSSSIATGMSMSLKETPQSVSVITQQRIQDQGMDNLEDLMSSATGVTVTQNDGLGRVSYRARGFKITNFKIDGLTTNYDDDFGGMINLDLYDHVDIIRGANGLLGGTGDPSATVNYVRKAPGKQFATKMGITYGKWDKRRAFADVNTPLGFDGKVRSRFVISAEDSGSYLDRAGLKNVSGLISFSADITSSTTLNLGAQYDQVHLKGASWGSNVPIWFSDGSPTNLPRSTNPVPDWAYTDNHSTTFFGSLEQYFLGDWKTKISFSHNDFSSVQPHGVSKPNKIKGSNKFGGFWNKDGTGAYLTAIYSDGKNKMDDIDWSVNGIVHLFGRDHELMGGFNYSRLVTTDYTFNQKKYNNCDINGQEVYSDCIYRIGSLPIADWRTWDGHYPGFNVHRTDARDETTTTNYGGYLAGRFSLADPLSAILGVRLSNYETNKDTYSDKNIIIKRSSGHHNGVFTPYAGVVFDINENYSVYTSYTSVFSPQTGKEDESGKQIDPVTGNSYEVGLKGEFFDNRLNASAIAFMSDRRNVAQKTGKDTPSGKDAYAANEAGVRSTGLEFEFSGMITDNWNMYLGYTYLHVKDPKPQETSKSTGEVSFDDPHHVFRAFTTYHLAGVLDGLTVGGGIRAQSYTLGHHTPGNAKRPNSKDDSLLKLRGYSLVDLMARYQFNKNVALSFNINNLFDTTYYRQRGFYAGQIYGEPRSYWATLNVTY